jgi:quinol monooxygenase YgiN
MPESLLTVVAHFEAKPGKEQELREALLALVEPTRKEEGCVQYDLHVDTENPGKFVFYENWTSREHLSRHAASAHIAAFGARKGELAAHAEVLTFTRIA